MRETKVEGHLTKESEKRGILSYKFVSPQHNGVPDRLLIGYGLTVYVETKAPGKVPRALQEYQHEILRAHGAKVYVLDTIEKVDEFFSGPNPFSKFLTKQQ